MKKLLALILILMLALSLTACGDAAKGDKKDDKVSKTNEEEKKDEKDEEEKEDQQAQEEKAGLEDKLVVYSTHPEALLEIVADAFAEKTGVEVEFINLKGELADRVRAEKDNPQADIMYGGASSLFIEMSGEGLFEKTSPSWDSELDSTFKGAGGDWYGTIKTPVMIFYNTEMMSEEEAPKDWADLAKEEYAGKIVSRDTLSSSIRATLMSLISRYENKDDAWAYLTKLDANIKNYYNSGSMQFQAVGKKEAPISFAVLSAVTQNIDKNSMPLKVVDAASGSIVITDGIAAIKNAPHPNAAAAFVDFAGSAEIQAKLANEQNRIPTLKSAVEMAPEWMKTEYKYMDVDWKVISENQGEWLQKFDTEIRDSSKDVKKD